MHLQHMSAINQRGFLIIELVMVLSIITALTVMVIAVFLNESGDLVATPHVSHSNSAPKEACVSSRTTNTF